MLDKAPRRRRTQVEMMELIDAIQHVVAENQPMTARQVFYQLVVRRIIDKTEAEYQNVVIRLLREMRMNGTMSWGWIVDETRHMRVPTTFKNIQDALEDAANSYRRSAMDECSQDYLEIWIEKNALAGVLINVTWDYDVPLCPSVGLSSLTFLHDTAISIESAARQGKRTYIYQFGDHDPTGVLIPESMEANLIQMCEQLECEPPIVERVALLREHIWQYSLPTRPTKTQEQGNRHAKHFVGESVELDALPPHVLRSMVRKVILKHMKQRDVDALRAKEDKEREVLRTMRPARKPKPKRKNSTKTTA